MKNTVSSPTAQRLKAAGVPQPEPEAGQVWYEGQKAYVLGKIEQRQLHGVYLDGECFEACDINAMHDDIFAPTATDILAALFPAEIQFQISAMQVLQMALDPESAALAWLEIHEKKAFTPNARIKFVREQVVECYDAEGNQTVLHIDSSMGKEYEAIVTDETVTIESVFGLITLPRKEAFILEWL